MSSMLEQAIIDAKALKEAAIKNAESTIVEKYAGEVRQAVEKLLEQDPLEDEELGGEEEMAMGDELGAEDLPDAAVMDAIPMGHDSGAEDVIEIDLDQIMAAAEEEPAGEDDEMDREEMADELGIPELEDEEEALDPSFDDIEAAGNRSDEELDNSELEIDEENLVEMFKEMLSLEIPEEAKEALDEMEDDEGEKEDDDEEEEHHKLLDGQDPKELEELKTNNAELQNKLSESATKNKELLELLGRAKERLQEINLSNARLFYINRVLEDNSLNERQRKQLAEHIHKAHSVDEAKTIFETLQKTVGSRSAKRKTKSLSEVVTRQSSTVLSSRREVASTKENPEASRWAKLAGIDNN
jgi:hypothetical protein